MEPGGRNRLQPVAIGSLAKRPDEAEPVAVDYDPLPFRAHGKGRVDATSLLLKRGSPSSLRKEPSPANPKAHRTSRTTLPGGGLVVN